ncbi:MAG: hypothetical protein JXR70_06440 [Spirochaetales bacterium]|nr:hypothetical protein [Spirochaetales bacterium]
MKKIPVLVLLFLSIAVNFFGQEQISRKVIIFDLINLGDSAETDSSRVFKQAIKSNLEFGLENQGFTILDDSLWQNILTREKIDSNDLVQGDLAIKVGSLASADVVISGFYKINQNRILFGIKCYDVFSGSLAVSTLKVGRAGLSLTTLINETISEVIPQIKAEIASMTAVGDKIEKEVIITESVQMTKVTEMGETIKVRIKSVDEGAEVYLADEKIGTITGGGLLIKSKIGSTLQLLITKEGYHSRETEIKVQDRDLEIPIPPLFRKTTMALDLRYTILQFVGLGAGLRYYFIKDWTFVSGLNYFYAQIGEGPEANPVFHNDVTLTIGQYLLFNEDSAFRAGVSAGFGGIFNFFTVPEAPLYIDTYFDVLGLFFEWNLKDFLLYYQFSLRYVAPVFEDHIQEKGYIKNGVFSFGACLKW